MYDALCLFPHANGSHSLIHYLNQHRRLHVAPYTTLCRSMDDLLAYERNIRPWMPVVCAATKDYHLPDVAEKFLAVSKRDIIIQTTRDPVESFVAQTNNDFFVRTFDAVGAGKPVPPPVMEEIIADAVTRFITPAAAEKAYETDSFERHILVDVEDLKGTKAQGTVESLWSMLGGDAAPENRVSNHFRAIGSRSYARLRAVGPFQFHVGALPVMIFPVQEGDLWNWYYDAPNNYYAGRDAVLWEYEDVNLLLPAMRLSGPLRVAAIPQEWNRVHRAVRDAVIPQILPVFEQRMRAINHIFAEAEKAMIFKLDNLTPVQTDMLKFGIEEDFRTFLRRHPQTAERWTVTRNFLGI